MCRKPNANNVLGLTGEAEHTHCIGGGGMVTRLQKKKEYMQATTRRCDTQQIKPADAHKTGVGFDLALLGSRLEGLHIDVGPKIERKRQTKHKG
jgi:hypothetical protein